MGVPGVAKWHVAGDWFYTCKCEIPCPCSFAQPPTYGDCDGIRLWHIRTGDYGDLGLSGLNVAMLISYAGNVWTGEHHDARAAFFFDERGGEAQLAALRAIFTGRAGGWPQRFVEMLRPEIVAVESSPIEVRIADDLAGWSVRLPGYAEAAVEALTGPTAAEGVRVQVHNLPGAEVGPGQPLATWGRATLDRADAFGFSWERVGNSSTHIPFGWTGPEAA
ncbi:DUF1326 domain-containing protein [Saccharopolyspora sp. ASAGF58]|uniref:DUF1326 domain-containing protein n=1 Tax=Saccharopolyspora sp. ASAGF58 TaxID=2719023 RepID=UPI0014400A65|nr:DUF1326 domain-containing protein [Saccharopolyspora sp. ASAGF58]QIZ39188.1 DUF1326 domain-containing protein [Saccharopolyspora sp. ASAGF58]